MSNFKSLITSVVTLSVVAGCATTGATFRSGVGDAHLEHPPYYAGTARPTQLEGQRIGRLPVAYQRGAAQAPIFDPRDEASSPIRALLGEMNAYLDSLAAGTGLGVRLVEAGQITAAATGQPPDVQFGCLTEGNLPGEDCVQRGDSALGRGNQRMRLAVGRPASEWTSWMRDVAREKSVDRVLMLTLEVGQYLPRQVGWRGDKEVELGTAHVARLPWLTSLETPVLVLQLTGALVDTTGRALRIGAEGFLPVRTSLAVSSLGAVQLLRDADVQAARTLRRTDLEGQPLAWQVALANLVVQLTGRGSCQPRCA